MSRTIVIRNGEPAGVIRMRDKFRVEFKSVYLGLYADKGEAAKARRYMERKHSKTPVDGVLLEYLKATSAGLIPARLKR